MSLITDSSCLPLLLNGPIYILPEPTHPPVFPPQVAPAPIRLPEMPPVTSPVTLKATVAPTPVLEVPQTVPDDPSPAPDRNRQVMILYNEQTTPYLQPVHEALLKNILKSVGLTLEDVELINLNNIKRIDYVSILREKTLNQLISFGINLDELEIHVPLTAYAVKKEEGIYMLLADSLHELELNTDKKRMLWACLKQMFLK